MILYFSGTGNSAYVAKRIAEQIHDETINLFEKIRSNDYSEMHSEKPWVIVTPTYAWRIPRIVQKWLEHTKLTGSKSIYFVMTCGDSNGNAGKYTEQLCRTLNMTFRGCYEVVMPENYIAMFTAPQLTESLEIIHKADTVIDTAADWIKRGEAFPQPHITFGGRLSSGIVNDVFYPMFVHAKQFYVTDDCISCGKCSTVCPMNNIRMENGKPVWEDHCTHCMACICGCPKEAIEYGKHSKGKVRYICPK